MSDEAIGSFILCSIRVTDAKNGNLLSEQRQGLSAIYKFNMAIEMFYGVTLSPQAHRDSKTKLHRRRSKCAAEQR